MEYKEKPKIWYALFVLTGKENEVRDRLQYRFKNIEIRVVVPRRSLRERKNGEWAFKTKPLFPGYVLINGYIGVKEYYMLKDVPGLLRVLRSGYDMQEIDEQEMSVIGKMICNSDIVGISSIYTKDDRIVVTSGPLLGLEGFIETVDKRKGRAKVRINFLGEPRTVDFGIAAIQTV